MNHHVNHSGSGHGNGRGRSLGAGRRLTRRGALGLLSATAAGVLGGCTALPTSSGVSRSGVAASDTNALIETAPGPGEGDSAEASSTASCVPPRRVLRRLRHRQAVPHRAHRHPVEAPGDGERLQRLDRAAGLGGRPTAPSR